MKKNFKTLATTGLLVGILTIGSASAFVMANGNAYGNYKNAALQTLSNKNMTITASGAVTEDGVAVMSGDGLTQKDGNNSYSTGTMQVNGQSIDTEVAKSDGKVIMRNGDKYTSAEYGSSDKGKEDRLASSPNTVKLGQMVTDLLVGNVSTQFVENGNTVSVSLSGAQIPDLMNVAVSAMFEQATAEQDNPQRNNEKLYGDALKNLSITQNASVKSINMTADIVDGYLSDNSFDIVLSGQDNAGNSHEIELTLKANIASIGSTTAGTIDVAGKTVTPSQITK